MLAQGRVGQTVRRNAITAGSGAPKALHRRRRQATRPMASESFRRPEDASTRELHSPCMRGPSSWRMISRREYTRLQRGTDGTFRRSPSPGTRRRPRSRPAKPQPLPRTKTSPSRMRRGVTYSTELISYFPHTNSPAPPQARKCHEKTPFCTLRTPSCTPFAGEKTPNVAPSRPPSRACR